MTLIDKDALIAEIERIKHETNYEPFTDEVLGKRYVCGSLLSFLDTLEVKEVDLDKEIDDWYNNEASKEFENVLYEDIEKCAKHFFELGLNASSSLTWEDLKLLQDISHEVFAEVANGNIDYYQIYPTEQSFLKEVLKRFKAQKGK